MESIGSESNLLFYTNHTVYFRILWHGNVRDAANLLISNPIQWGEKWTYSNVISTCVPFFLFIFFLRDDMGSFPFDFAEYEHWKISHTFFFLSRNIHITIKMRSKWQQRKISFPLQFLLPSILNVNYVCVFVCQCNERAKFSHSSYPELIQYFHSVFNMASWIKIPVRLVEPIAKWTLNNWIYLAEIDRSLLRNANSQRWASKGWLNILLNFVMK